MRTREDVEREYGAEKWPAVEALIASERAAAPEAGLGCILSRVARSWWLSGDPLVPAASFVLEGAKVQASPSAALGAARGVVLDVVADSADEETDLIAELGSGWGWLLLSVWASGGPRAAKYVAAEYTEAGRRATGSIAELDPDLDFEAIAFDYHEPVLDGLGRRQHAVVFTAHSIEQIPEVSPQLFEAIRGIAPRVTCIHFEPVGWQLDGYRGIGSSRPYAEQHGYNLNLIATLRAEQSAGRIEIDEIRPDAFGINPENSTTIVRWRAGHAS